ncbi:MAG: LD-carboxypeptidase [Sphingobium sp.]
MFSRRATIGGIGSLLTLLSFPAAPLSARPPSRPPRLRPGDTVGLIEPAGFSDGQPQIDAVKATITGMGLVPKVAPHVLSRFGYLAGTDRDRAVDINAMFADESVRAIFAVRGGWGCARLLPFLDWDVIRANPKLLIGFSDITALHLAFAARAGFPTIHGPNAANSWSKISWDSFWRLAFSGETPNFLPPDAQTMDPSLPDRRTIRTIHAGKASGRLIGGNLSVLAALIGTPWLPDLDGAILFLEEVGEAEYRIDRLLSQLALSGQLRRVAGVIFGQCARCGSNLPGYIGFTIPQLLDQYLAPLGIPAFQGANIGHVANQLCLPVGVRVEMDADTGGIRVLEPVVA